MTEQSTINKFKEIYKSLIRKHARKPTLEELVDATKISETEIKSLFGEIGNKEFYLEVAEYLPQDEHELNFGKQKETINSFEKAIEGFSELIESKPDDAFYYKCRADLYKTIVQYDNAIEDYNKAIELEPGNVSHYEDRADLYREMEDYERAIEDYIEAIKIDNKSFHSYFNCGLARTKIKDYDNAIQDYINAIKLCPNKFKERFHKVKKSKANLKIQKELLRLFPDLLD